MLNEKTAGRRMTRQRQAIMEMLAKTDEHPTAEMVYEAVRKQLPEISLGTVYRNLDCLTAQGIIKKLQRVGCEDRYDYMRVPHNHAVCTVCGKVFDFVYPLDADALQAAVGGAEAFRLSDADFSVTGVCGECARRAAEKARE